MLQAVIQPAERRTAFQRAQRAFGQSVAGHSALALVDQGVLSVGRFATLLLIERLAGHSDLGIYSLGFSLLMVVQAMEESLIETPYAVYVHRLEGDVRARFAGSTLAHCGLLSLLSVLFMAAAACLFRFGIGPPGMETVAWVLAVATPPILLQEFGRRYAFAHLRVGTALAIDVATVAIQVMCLAALAVGGCLTAATACASMGLASAVAGLVWLVRQRKDFAVRWASVMQDLRHNWTLGKWVFASEMVIATEISAVLWILTLLKGPAITGVFAACMTLLSIVRPFWLGVNNLLTPRFARALHAGGSAELVRTFRQTLVLLGTGISGFCLVLLVFGDRILAVLYKHHHPDEHLTIMLLALSLLPLPLSLAANHALRALERPEWNLWANATHMAATLGIAVCLIGPLGIVGAAAAVLAGSPCAAAVRGWRLRMVIRSRRAQDAETNCSASSTAADLWCGDQASSAALTGEVL